MAAYLLATSTRPTKKYCITTPEGRKIHFGGRGYEDYTTHKDPERKRRYVARHSARESWNKAGVESPGFWSRWLLWNKPTLKESIEDTAARFRITIRRTRRA